MSFLKLTASDCSPLGEFILQYLENNQLTMTELADKVGISRPGLRGMCLKRGNPTESSLKKLSNATGKPVEDLRRLVWQNRLINVYGRDVIDDILDGIEIIFKALFDMAKRLPEQERPSEDELFDRAIRIAESVPVQS